MLKKNENVYLIEVEIVGVVLFVGVIFFYSFTSDVTIINDSFPFSKERYEN